MLGSISMSRHICLTRLSSCPVQILKLEHEEERVRPATLPGTKPMMINSRGSAFEVTAIDTAATLARWTLRFTTPQTLRRQRNCMIPRLRGSR